MPESDAPESQDGDSRDPGGVTVAARASAASRFRRLDALLILRTACIALLYFAAVKCGQQFVYSTKSVTAFWPAAGVAFAVFALWGSRAWPGVFLGILLAVPDQPAFAARMAIALGNSLAYLAAVLAMRRTVGFEPSLARPRDVAALIAFTGLVSSPLHAANSAAWLGFPWAFAEQWWVGYFVGALLVAPVILTWTAALLQPRTTMKGPPGFFLNLPRCFECAALFLLLGLACDLTFSRSFLFPAGSSFRFEYSVFPLVIWAALRFGQRATSLASLTIGIAAIWGAVHYRGPFAFGTYEERFAALNVFLSITAVTSLMLGAVTAERNRARTQIEGHLRERDESLSALRESEDRFRATFRQAPVGICHLTPDGTFVRANPELCRMLGVPEKELAGQSFDDFTHPDDLAAERDHTRSLMLGLTPAYTMLKRCFHRDGHVVYVQLNVSLVRSQSELPDYLIAVVKDVTARRNALEGLRFAEERFRWLVDANPAGVIEALRDGTIQRANDAFYRIIGWDREEFARAGMDLLKITPPDWMETTVRVVQACFENGASDMYEKEYQRFDGTRVPVMVALAVHPERRGETLAFIVDLSEQKRAEAELRKSEERLQAAQRAAHAGVYELDLRTLRWEWSEEMYSIHGLPPGTAITNELCISIVSPEDRDRVAAAFHDSLRTGAPYNVEFRVQKGEGTIWIASTGRVAFEESAPVRFTGIAIDISQRKAAEIALQSSELQLRQLADAMPQIVWTARPDGTVYYHNRKGHEFFPIDLEDPEGWTAILHPDDRQRAVDTWREAVLTGSAYEIQYRFWDRAAGAFRWYLGRGLPLREERGEIVRWIGTCTDIDDQKRFAEQLETAVATRTAELVDSLREKTTLLQELHHRVKNNLQVVCSLLSMQLDYTSDTTISDSLLRALHRVESMALVHEQLYKAENLSRLDLSDYIEHLAESLFQAYCLDTARIALELAVEPIDITIDEAIPCGLILNELVSNSLKHAFPGTREGWIRVSMRRISDGRVELKVEDNGVGQPAASGAGRLGMRVVNALVCQIRAEMKVDTREGTSTVVVWRTQ